MKRKIKQNKNAAFCYCVFKQITCIILLFFIASCSDTVSKKEESIYSFSKEYESQINEIISTMTLEEKIAMLYANGKFSSNGVERLNIPELNYTDGPFGVREEMEKHSWESAGLTTDSATYLPTGSALAATWSKEAAYEYGKVLGEEARARGKDFFLGPAVNINRTPLCGRNFEYLSEDPVLNSELCVQYIKGVQTSDVAACVKHFAANNQEANRDIVNVIMDEQTLREIYLPAFKAAVTRGGARSVMGAYNKFRGEYCCESSYLLNNILKGEWNFQGVVVSDWGAVHSTVPSALGGLDVEMGTDGDYKSYYMADALVEAVKKGEVSDSLINDKVRRMLRIVFNCKTTGKNRDKGSMTTTEHFNTAYRVASEAVVLLENSKGILPLDMSSVKSIAVIGDNAIREHGHLGFGATVKAKYEITPLEALKNKFGNNTEITFAQGYKHSFKEGDKRRFGKEPINEPNKELLNKAVEVAKQSDVAVLFVGSSHHIESESVDRRDIKLPFGQEELIEAVTAANPNTVVVMIAGAPFDLNRVKRASPTLLWSWFNGSEGGNAIADVISGKVNPSGKLPFTIPMSLDDSPAHALNTYPGDSTVHFREGILVGYRWYDTKSVNPLYCFGYGLSYTTFDYASVSTDKKIYTATDSVIVNFTLTNSGKTGGYEVVQLYVNDTGSEITRPEKELKAFSKVFIEAGKQKQVRLAMAVSDLACFDNSTMKWITEPGKYKLLICSSSKNILLTETIEVGE